MTVTDVRAEVSAPVAQKTAGAITQKNFSIQSARGVAALFVVLYHASVYSGRQFGESGWATTFDGRFALIGVAVFFAISGLLMADLVQRTDPWRFLAHRIVRIYPLYLLAVAAWLSIDAFLRIHSIGFHLFSLLLVPAGQRDYYLGVEWTLVFECMYYVALFGVALIGWQGYLNRIIAVWIIVIGLAPLFIGWNDSLFYRLYSVWLAPANAAFMGGLLIPWLTSKVRIPFGTGAIAVCGLMLWYPADPMIARWTGGAVATLLVMDLMQITIPQGGLFGLPKLGDWSYALYLCHVPCILIVYYWWPSSTAIGMAWFTAVATSLVVAAAFGMLDVRMYRYFKSAVDSAEKQRRRRLVNIYAGAFVLASLIALVVT